MLIKHNEWETVWSTHAINRTYDRRSHPVVAEAALHDILEKATAKYPDLLKNSGRLTIRSFPETAYFGVTLDAAAHKIGILTYGDISKFFPKSGDKVLTISPDHRISFVTWQRSETA